MNRSSRTAQGIHIWYTNPDIQYGKTVIRIMPHASCVQRGARTGIFPLPATHLTTETAPSNRHAGNAKAEKNTSSKNWQNVPEKKAVAVRQNAFFYRCRETCTVTETLSVRGRINLCRVTTTCRAPNSFRQTFPMSSASVSTSLRGLVMASDRRARAMAS